MDPNEEIEAHSIYGTSSKLRLMQFVALFIGSILGNLAALIAWQLVFPEHDHPKNQRACSETHREGPEHDQHDVCDQYTRKEK